jgi:hypothetical protein
MVCMCLTHQRNWGSRARVGFAADKAMREQLSWESSVYLCQPCVHPDQQCVVWHRVIKCLIFLWIYTQWCTWIALGNFGIQLETLLGTTTHLYSVRLSVRLQLLRNFQKQLKVGTLYRCKEASVNSPCLVRICEGNPTYFRKQFWWQTNSMQQITFW